MILMSGKALSILTFTNIFRFGFAVCLTSLFLMSVAAQTQPGSPTHKVIESVTQSSFEVSWTVPADIGGAQLSDVTYDVYWDIDETCTDTKTHNQREVSGTSLVITTFNRVDLEEITQYWVAVRTRNGSGTPSAWTDCHSVTTRRVLQVPNNLRATTKDDKSATVAWDIPNIAQYEEEPAVNIPDDTSAQDTTSTITVPDGTFIDAISISVDITHTYIGDLKVDLVAPGGTVITLHDRTGNDAGRIDETYFDELTSLINTDASGDWRLQVGDYAVDDTGTLNAWTITIGDISRVTDYDVERFATQKTCESGTDPTTVTPVNVDERTATATGLDAGTTYHFRVRSTDGRSTSPYSDCVAVETDQGIASPDNLRATTKTDEHIALAWDLVDTFAHTETPDADITDNTGTQDTTSTITVDESTIIDAVSVSVDITHAYVGDLKIDLIVPDGTIIPLRDREGGEGLGQIVETYVDELAGLVGTDAAGDWELRVGDYSDSDDGTLDSWTLEIGDIDRITDYDVERFATRKACESGTDPTAVTPVNVDERTATATGLDAGTAYYFRVRSVDGTIGGVYSSCIAAETNKGLVAPINLRDTARDDRSITFAWDLPNVFSRTATAREPIDDDTDAQDTTSVISISKGIVIDAISVSVGITHTYIGDLKIDLVAPDGSVIVLRDRTGGPGSGELVETYVTELAGLIGDDAEGDWELRVGDYSSSDDGTLDSWTITIGDTVQATDYDLERFATEKACDAGTNPTTVTSVNVDERTATATGLDIDTTYYFRIQSIDGTSESGYSACASAATSRGVLAPENVRATTRTGNSITLTWDRLDTFSRTETVNETIPDDTGSQRTTSVITVPNSMTIDAVSAAVDITHTHVGDLKVDLVAPDGSVIVLHNRSASDESGRLVKTYTDELDDLIGDDAAGDWELRVGDYAAADVGTFNSWTLEIGDVDQVTDYDVERFATQEDCDAGNDPTVITPVNVADRTATATGLDADTTYHFRVRSVVGTDFKPYSSCFATSTSRGVATPSNLRVAAKTDESVTLAWDLADIDDRRYTAMPDADIPDHTGAQGTTSVIAVPKGVFVDVGTSVSVDIDHNHIGDLKVDLVAPDASVIVLHNRAGAGETQLIETYVTELAGLVGDDAAGNWRLRVGDYSGDDTGTLNEWTIDFGGASEATGYDLERFATDKACDAGDDPTAVTPVDVDERTATATGLDADTSYHFRVRSVGGTNVSPYSDCLAVKTDRGVSSPENLRATEKTDESITLAWDVGDASEGALYDLERFEDGNFCATASDELQDGLVDLAEDAESRTAVAGGLEPATDYWFRVRTYMNGLWSPYTDCLSVRTPDRRSAVKPGVPAHVRVTEIDHASFDISWEAPKDLVSSVGNGVTFDVYWDDDSQCQENNEFDRVTTAKTSFNIDAIGEDGRLNPGTLYWFTVRTNSNGEVSDWTTCTEVTTSPTEVDRGSGEGDEGSGEGDGGDEGDEGSGEGGEGSGEGDEGSGDEEPADRCALRPGAVPSISLWSFFGEAATPTSLNVSFWRPAPPSAACPIAGDQLLLYMSGTSCAADADGSVGTIRGKRVTGLSPSTTYWFKARARTDAGWGPFSSCASFTTLPPPPPSVAPGAPVNVSVTPSMSRPSRALSVRGEPPADDGGEPISSYRLEFFEGSCDGDPIRTQSNSAPQFYVSDLNPDTVYCASLASENSVGIGPAAQGVGSTDPYPSPGPPISLRQMHASPTSVTMAWNTRRGEDLPILGYDLYRYSDVACTEDEVAVPVPTRFSVTGATATATGLETATTYYFAVRAENAVGKGAFSSCEPGTTTFDR